MRRRSLLRGSALAFPALALAGCGIVTSTTTNGVTTYTINVSELETYVSGAAALAASLLGVPGISTAIGAATSSLIDQVISDLNAAIPAINTQAAGAVKISFTTSSAPAFIASLEQDAASLVSYTKTAITSFGASVPAQVTTYYNAIVSVANALSGVLSVGSTVSHKYGAVFGASPMSVADALAIVNIKAPN